MFSLIHFLLQKEAGRRIQMQVLMNLLTCSLDLPRRNLLGMPSHEALEVFAVLTAKYLDDCSIKQQQKLHEGALRLGRRLRRCLAKRDAESLTRLTFLLYGNIGIHMEGHFPGMVRVPECHFQRHYSPRTCAVASMMDSGVISGLFQEDSFRFHQRLTEGKPCCICSLNSLSQEPRNEYRIP